MYQKLINYINHMSKGNVPFILRKEDIIHLVDVHPIPSMYDVQDHLRRAGLAAMVVSCEVSGVAWEILIAHSDPAVTFRAR